MQQTYVGTRKAKLGDRPDGFRVRKTDAIFQLIPVIMRSRLDSMVFFEDTIDVEDLDAYVRAKRASDLPNLRLLHVLMAAMVRTLSQRPRLNRFIVGKKIYARRHIRFAIAIKRSMTDEGEETTIMPTFLPTDTLSDVVRRFNETLEASRNEAGTASNSTDAVSRVIGALPMFIKSGVVGLVRWTDDRGIMPAMLRGASPFHSTAFITDMGSLGVGPIYHHLYEFGTCSIFVAIGKRELQLTQKPDGTVTQKKVIRIRVTGDERISDGFYMASTIKMMMRLLRHPEKLETPPDSVVEDLD